VLEDGTIVELNQGAQLSLHFTAGTRRINLTSGEAHFQVAKDPERPFVVRAAGTEVTAVGTGFNVSLLQDALEVIVTEGRITVRPPVGPLAAAGGPEEELPAQALTAGQGTVVALEPRSAPLVIRDYPSELIEQKLAWKSELLNFTGAPLSEVILEFNRRNHTQLVLGDEEAGRLKITGAMRPTDLEGLIQVLAVTENVRAERHEPSKIVLRKSRAPGRSD
jgi:transmembrane sensor